MARAMLCAAVGRSVGRVQRMTESINDHTGLRLHNRVAIVVPDEPFRAELEPLLAAALTERFPTWNQVLVDAATASSDIGPPPRPQLPSAEDASESSSASSSAATATATATRPPPTATDWIVLDTIGQLDGLERLVVVAVGLDAEIQLPGTSVAGSADAPVVAGGGGGSGAAVQSVVGDPDGMYVVFGWAVTPGDCCQFPP